MQSFRFKSREALLAGIHSRLGPGAVISKIASVPAPGLRGLLGAREIEVSVNMEAEPSPRWIEQWTDFLAAFGVIPEIARELVLAAQPGEPLSESSRMAEFPKFVTALQARWPQPAPLLSNVRVFLGSPGSGKSTVVASLLAREQMISGRMTRAHAAGQAERLSLFCEMMGVPFDRRPRPLLAQDERLFIEESGFDISGYPGGACYLVCNAAYETERILEQALAFPAGQLAGIILTHLDEEPRWGKIVSVALGTNCSVTHLNAGQNVPADLAEASPELVLARIFC